MRWLLLLAMAMAMAMACAQRLSAAAQVADQTVRYVNDQMISLGDVLERNQNRLGSQPKLHPPANAEERLAFCKISLEELTDEELLIQYARQFADEHKLQLVDHERITQMVMERARASGRNMTLREQAFQRKLIERRQTMDFILGFFETRSANITPADLWRDFQSRPKDFYRPPRARVLEIMLRPSSPAERQEVRQAKLAAFKRAQDAADEAVKKVADSRLDAYLAAAPAEQERLLGEVVKELAGMADRTDLDPASRKIVDGAKQTADHEAALRDADQTLQQLQAIRAQLEGKDAEAFKKVAREVSQGPSATEGGDRGWLEPGSEGQEFDAEVFSLKAGALSPVFRTDQAAYLVLVSECVEARNRDFAEVTGEIESGLRPKRQEAIRREVVDMMRGKASIRDVADLGPLAQ